MITSDELLLSVLSLSDLELVTQSFGRDIRVLALSSAKHPADELTRLQVAWSQIGLGYSELQQHNRTSFSVSTQYRVISPLQIRKLVMAHPNNAQFLALYAPDPRLDEFVDIVTDEKKWRSNAALAPRTTPGIMNAVNVGRNNA